MPADTVCLVLTAAPVAFYGFGRGGRCSNETVDRLAEVVAAQMCVFVCACACFFFFPVSTVIDSQVKQKTAKSEKPA